MMKSAFFIFILFGFLLTACGAKAGDTGATQESASPVALEEVVIAEGRVEPVRYTELALNASGLVSEVMLTEGSPVTAGEVIARLKSPQALTLEDARAQNFQSLTQAYEQVRDAKYDLDNFDVPAEFSGQSPEQAVASTLEKLNVARDNFEPYEDLNEKRLELSEKEKADESKIYRDTAKIYKKRLDDAWSKYRRAIQWMELESALETANVQLSQAEQDYQALMDESLSETTAGVRASLANAELRAPFAGTITKLDLKVGEFAAAGQPVVTIADMSTWVVKTTDLTEIDVVGITEGQPVTITLDAIPDIELRGNVLSVGQGYAEQQGDIVYEVTILLAEQDTSMRWGMTAEIRFQR